jgi:hypothetical protein
VRFSFLDERGLVGLGVVIQGGWRFIFFTFVSWRWSVRWWDDGVLLCQSAIFNLNVRYFLFRRDCIYCGSDGCCGMSDVGTGSVVMMMTVLC